MSFDGVILMSLIFLILISIAILNSVTELNENSKTVKHYVNKKKLIIPLEEEMSYNCLLVYEFLYYHKYTNYSYRQIANNINLPTSSVIMAVADLEKKGYVYKRKINYVNKITISGKGINHFIWSKSGL